MIEVRLDIIGRRCVCLACDKTIEKFEVHGLAVDESGDDRPFAICTACLFGDLGPRLRHQATVTREDAAWVESLADETWILPTEVELVVKQAEEVMGWAAMAQEDGLA